MTNLQDPIANVLSFNSIQTINFITPTPAQKSSNCKWNNQNRPTWTLINMQKTVFKTAREDFPFSWSWTPCIPLHRCDSSQVWMLNTASSIANQLQIGILLDKSWLILVFMDCQIYSPIFMHDVNISCLREYVRKEKMHSGDRAVIIDCTHPRNKLLLWSLVMTSAEFLSSERTVCFTSKLTCSPTILTIKFEII